MSEISDPHKHDRASQSDQARSGKSRSGFRPPVDPERLRVLIPAALALLIIVLFFIFIFRLDALTREAKQAKEKPLPEESGNLATPLQSRDLEAVQAESAYPLGEHLLFLSKDQLLLEDMQGTQVYACPMHLNRPAVVNVGGLLLCGDREGTQLMLMGLNGPLFETELDGALAGAAANGRDALAVIDEVPEGNARVHLMNLQGKRVFTLSFDRSGSPLQLSFSPDGKSLDVLILNTSGSRMKSILRRYNVADGAQTAERAIEAYDEFFYGLSHDLRGNPCIYSSTHLLSYDYASAEPPREMEFANLRMVFAPHGKLTVLAGQELGGGLSLFSFNDALEAEEKISALPSSTEFFQAGNILCLTYGSHLLIYDGDSQRKTGDLLLDGDIIRVLPLGDKLHVVTNRGSRILRRP